MIFNDIRLKGVTQRGVRDAYEEERMEFFSALGSVENESFQIVQEGADVR